MKETILPEIRLMKSEWSSYLKDHKQSFIVAMICLILAPWSYADFVRLVEQHAGFAFEDPVLEWSSPVDLTWLIFGLISGSLLTAIIHLLDKVDRY